MKSNVIKLRRDVAPLNLCYDIVTLTPLSTLHQVYNVLDDTYEPSRVVNHCVLGVHAVCSTSDGTIDNMDIAAKLTEHEWTINFGDGFKSVTDFQDAFEVRGSQLHIKKDYPTGTRAVIRYSGTYLDVRTNRPITIAPDEVVMYTTEAGESSKVLLLSDNATDYTYDITADNRRLQEYTEAHEGIDPTIQSTPSYLVSYHVEVKSGKNTIAYKNEDGSKNYRIVIYNKGNVYHDKKKSIIGKSVEVKENVITVDMRTIQDDCLQVVAVNNKDRILCSASISVAYLNQIADPIIVDNAYLDDSPTRTEEICINERGRYLRYPSAVYDLKTCSQLTNSDAVVEHGFGANPTIVVNRLGKITNNNDANMWVEYDKKGLSSFVTINGEILTDESNDPIII